MRKFILLLTLSAALLPLQAQRDETSRLRIAASQYEIIELLIQKHDYSQVLGEYRKILALNLEDEKALVQATQLIAVEHLGPAGQYSLAIQLINEALNSARLTDSKFYLLMMKGKVLKEQGKLQEAIEIYRKAQEFAPASEAAEK